MYTVTSALHILAGVVLLLSSWIFAVFALVASQLLRMLLHTVSRVSSSVASMDDSRDCAASRTTLRLAELQLRQAKCAGWTTTSDKRSKRHLQPTADDLSKFSPVEFTLHIG